MAQKEPPRKNPRAASRDAYRREFEERRAKRLSSSLKVAPFDPAKFVEGVRIQSWGTIHTVIYAVALTAGLILLGRAAGSQAAGAFAALLLIGSVFYYLLRVWGLDIREIGRTTAVVGIWLTYFVTWLMVCFLITNPPVIDDAPPEIIAVAALVQAPNGTWVHSSLSATNTIINNTAQIRFQVGDNSPIERVTFEYSSWNGTAYPPVEMQLASDGNYSFTFTGLSQTPGHSYAFIISAIDSHKNRAEHHASLSIQHDDWPQIQNVEAFVQASDGSWVPGNASALDARVNNTAQVRFKVVDNLPLAAPPPIPVTFGYNAPATQASRAPEEIRPDSNGVYTFTFTQLSTATNATYAFTISVTDSLGQNIEYSGTLLINEE